MSTGRLGPKCEKGPCSRCGWFGKVSVATKICKEIVDKGGGTWQTCGGELKRNTMNAQSSQSSNLRKRERSEDNDEDVFNSFQQIGEMKRVNGENPLSEILKEHILKLIKNGIKAKNDHEYWKQFETLCDEWKLKNTGTDLMDPCIQRGRFENIYRIQIHDDIERELTIKEKQLAIKFDERKMLVIILGDNTDESGKWTEEEFENNCSLKLKVSLTLMFNESIEFST